MAGHANQAVHTNHERVFRETKLRDREKEKERERERERERNGRKNA
jgi:hypothetical protein